jgi:hypothetical protein
VVSIGGWDPDAAGKLLQEFESDLEKVRARDSEILFGPAYRLLRQSVAAYRAEAVALAALGLRAAIENGGYWALTHRRHGPGGWGLVPLGKPDGQQKFRNEDWEAKRSLEWMIDALERRGVLGRPLASSARVIKDHGAGIAHYAHRKDRATYREMGKPHSQPYQLPSPEASPGEVLEDIRATARILLRLTERDAEAARAPIYVVGGSAT